MEGQHLGAGARLSVVWQAGMPEQHQIDTVDHIARYAKSLVEALTTAGWHPRWIEVGLRVLPPRVVEIDVYGDVPRLDQASFAKLASVAIAACNLWAALDADAEIRLRPRLIPPETGLPAADARTVVAEPALAGPTAVLPATLESKVETSDRPVSPPPPPTPLAPADAAAPPPGRGRIGLGSLGRVGRDRSGPQDVHVSSTGDEDRPRIATRVLVALVFGGLLGLFGLPRLTTQFGAPAQAPAAQPLVTSVEPPLALPTLVPASKPPESAPTLAPMVLPTGAVVPPTAVPTFAAQPTAPATLAAHASAQSQVLFAERFLSPLLGWPHDPKGTAWFSNGTYQMTAREPGRFVAIGTPLPTQVGDVTISARFRKTGGPAGGGYGFIVRKQSATPLDGDNQLGRYIVLEAGDQGDIGIWQRDESRWIDILPWTHVTAVKVGQEPNELAVTTQGNRLRFVVNGVEVANLTHASLPSEGGVGVFVGGDLNEVSLEWLIVETAPALLAR